MSLGRGFPSDPGTETLGDFFVVRQFAHFADRGHRLRLNQTSQCYHRLVVRRRTGGLD